VSSAGDDERFGAILEAIDDPCDEGGYDIFCRDRNGALCPEHAEHCHPPEYPCIALLRRRLALQIIEINDRRRAQPPR
jgi:hypothetical protein